METVHIYPLGDLRPQLRRRLYEAQQEAARVWMCCRDLHLAARKQRTRWPDRDTLQQATKGGQFALHSQTIQMICHQFLANIDTTHQLKPAYPKMRYPYKEKRFFALLWPAQAVSYERGRVVLPMGRGRASLVLPVSVQGQASACKLVWRDGYELHVTVAVEPAEAPAGTAQATVDLGEIHQAAVTTNTGAALVVSGRGIRALKRRWNKASGQLARKRQRCQKYSRRWKKLQAARRQLSRRIRRQVRSLRHQGTHKVLDFCLQQGVSTLFIGNPHGVRDRDNGRHHNQRMAQWEYGKDIAYLTEKATRACIMSFTGDERGTSSRCPGCGRRQRVNGRVWRCRDRTCGFCGHRDIVGSVNMHPLAFGAKIAYPAQITYRRAGPVRVLQRDKEPLQVARAGPS